MLWKTFCATVRRHPRKVLITEVETGSTVTGPQLRQLAEARAATITKNAFQIQNSIAWFVEFLACQKAHIAALPLDPTLPLGGPRSVVAALRERTRRSVSLQPTAVIKLTSGTTGGTTPIPCTADHLLADGRQICATMGIRPRDINLALIPLGHSYGLGNLVLPLLQQATPVICATEFVPRQILEIITRYRVTVFPTVPAVLRALAALPAKKPATLRLVISAGAPLTPEIAQTFRQRYNLRPHDFYGSSETGGITYDGQPLRGVRVTLRRDGRICVASPAVVKGRQVLPDRGEWTKTGKLQLTGRVGVIANIGGKKVAPVEVESQLRQLAGVSDTWVTVIKNSRGDDFLVAAVETKRLAAEIERELAQRLAGWQMPKWFFLSAALPRTARGKLDTTQLRCRLEGRAPSRPRCVN